MLFIIAGTVTFPIGIEINAGDDFRLEIALSKDDTYALVVLRKSLECIGRAWPCIHITLCVVDFAIAHDFFYLCLGYFAALHTAFGVLGIFNISYSPIEATVAVRFRRGILAGRFGGGLGSCSLWLRRLFMLESPDEEKNNTQNKDNDEGSPLLIQFQSFCKTKGKGTRDKIQATRSQPERIYSSYCRSCPLCLVPFSSNFAPL